jgi:hypothetical protein
MALQPFAGPWPPFQFLDLLHSRWDSFYGGSGRRKAAACTHTSMLPVGLEPTIPVFERAKTVHALDRAATAIGAVQRCSVQIRTTLMQRFTAI